MEGLQQELTQESMWDAFESADSYEEKREIAKEVIALGFPIATKMVAELN